MYLATLVQEDWLQKLHFSFIITLFDVDDYSYNFIYVNISRRFHDEPFIIETFYFVFLYFKLDLNSKL